MEYSILVHLCDRRLAHLQHVFLLVVPAGPLEQLAASAGARILSWPIRRAPFPSTEGVRGEGSPRVFFAHPPLVDRASTHLQPTLEHLCDRRLAHLQHVSLLVVPAGPLEQLAASTGARILSWPIRRAPFPSTEGVRGELLFRGTVCLVRRTLARSNSWFFYWIPRVRGEGSPRVFFVHPPLADLVGWKIIYFWHVIIIHWQRSGYEFGKSASRFHSFCGIYVSTPVFAPRAFCG